VACYLVTLDEQFYLVLSKYFGQKWLAPRQVGPYAYATIFDPTVHRAISQEGGDWNGSLGILTLTDKRIDARALNIIWHRHHKECVCLLLQGIETHPAIKTAIVASCNYSGFYRWVRLYTSFTLNQTSYAGGVLYRGIFSHLPLHPAEVKCIQYY